MNNTNTKQTTAYSILFSIAIVHLFNDTIQSVIPAVYPLLKEKYALSFVQIGLITFAFQITASLLQPVVGTYTDKKPQPYSLIFGMLISLIGIVFLAFSSQFWMFVLAVALVGMGSSVFHPEASRVAYMASGGRRGLAQSIFQLGGNTGTAIGPLLVAIIVVLYGQRHIAWFAFSAIFGMLILIKLAKWYNERIEFRKKNKQLDHEYHPRLSKKQVQKSIIILLVLIFSKYFYVVSITNYFTFYLIDKFHISIASSQYFLFAFLAASAVGTLLGGHFGDKFGRKYIIWFSILGVAPFALFLPYADLLWTCILSVFIGLILSSAFPAILVYAQELLPGKIGMVSGLFYGFAFGMAGLGSAILGYFADKDGIEFVYAIVAFFPLIGMVTYFLPNLKGHS
jgi:FSR family fosmidomycin resistance protein-like MFS transporter